MTLRLILLLMLCVLVARVVWRVAGVVAAIAGRRRQGGVPARGVRMVRDPVCGTYVIPDRALSISDGRAEMFFCSESCHNKYRARSA